MATGNTSKYNNIISKSDLIQSGSPAVYELKPKKEKIGTLKRFTVGEKDLNKTNRTILLVGETGSGKSTLINALVNYAIGVKWEDDIWFKIVQNEEKRQSETQTSEEKEKRDQLESLMSEENGKRNCSESLNEKRNQSESLTSKEEEMKDQSQSQTPDVIMYQIFEGKTLPYSLTIIDTPGFGDTRGIEKDVIISERLLDWFRSDDGVYEIDAVGLVLKATENRLSDRLRYIFDSVMSLFGKNMEKNIVALITHSDGLTTENVLTALEAANIQCAKDEKNQPLYFMFNNHQDKQKTKKNKFALKIAWDLTTDGLSQFTDFLKKTEPQSLGTTIEVLKLRIRLKACIQNLRERIESIELKQREIQQTEEALKKHEEEMKNNQKFTVEVDEVYKDTETISGGMWAVFFNGAVCCTVCEENCHYPGCTMAWYPEHCEVIKDGRCTSCTGKCPVKDHVKGDKIYVTKTRKAMKDLEDVKEKYEKSKTNCATTTRLLENLKTETDDLQREKHQLLDESFQLVVSLQQIALKIDSLSTLVHLDFLIEKMKEKGDTEKIHKLEEMKSRVDKDQGLVAAMHYGFGQLTAAGSAVKGLFMKK